MNNEKIEIKKPPKKMSKAAHKALSELMGFAISLNRQDFSVFVEYSGHIDILRIGVHKGGWAKNKKPEYPVETNLDGRNFCNGKLYRNPLTPVGVKKLKELLIAASNCENASLKSPEKIISTDWLLNINTASSSLN